MITRLLAKVNTIHKVVKSRVSIINSTCTFSIGISAWAPAVRAVLTFSFVSRSTALLSIIPYVPLVMLQPPGIRSPIAARTLTVQRIKYGMAQHVLA